MKIPAAAARHSRSPLGLITPKRLVAAILAFGSIWILVHFYKSSSGNFPRVLHGFEANQGQFDSRTLFAMRTSTGMIALTEDGPELIAGDKASRMLKWIHQGTHPVTVKGLDQLRARANYFVGQDPRRWRSGVPMFGRVRYHDVAPGIDVDYYEQGGNLEFDVGVKPGADPTQARFTSDVPFRLDPSGDIRIGPDNSAMTLRAPAVYQDIGGVRHRVDGRFNIAANREVGFDISRYDKSRPLVIDPVLVASTFVGTLREAPQAVASDGQGAIYVAGETASSSHEEAFVAKFSSDLSELLYLTYFGGTKINAVQTMAVDQTGAAYIAGYTDSADFPVVNAFQPGLNLHCPSTFPPRDCGADGFVMKIGPDGSSLIYSTLNF